jgi:hypothetical protein
LLFLRELPTQGCDCGPVAAPDCHAGDSLLVPSPADVRVVGAGVSRSAAAERGEVLVLLVVWPQVGDENFDSAESRCCTGYIQQVVIGRAAAGGVPHVPIGWVRSQ